MNFQILILLSNLILIIALIPLTIRHARSGFRKMGRETLILLFMIFLTGLILRIPSMPSHTMTDEYYYMEAAKNILRTGEPNLCSYIDMETEYCSLVFKPLMFPAILSIAFLLFGVNSLAAVSVSVLFGSLSVVLIFLFAYLLFREREVGLWSALLLALTPMHITWSRTAETNVTSLFFVLLAFVLLLSYFRIRDKNIMVLGLLVTALAINIRPESLVLMVLVLILFCLFHRDSLKPGIGWLKDRKNWIWGAVFIIILIPYLLFISYALTHNRYTCTGGECYSSIYSLDAVKNNWETYGLLSFFSYTFHPVILSFLALSSFLFIRRYEKEALFLWVFFIIFYLILITYNLAHVRLVIPLYATTTVLAGFTLFWLNRYLKKYLRWVAPLILLVLILFSLYPYIMKTTAINPVSVLESMLPGMIENDIGGECYVMTENPSILNSKASIKTVRTEYALENPQILDNIIKNSGCTLFLEDMYYKFSGDFDRRENFNKINQTYSLILYKEYSFGGYEFQLYDLSFR